MADAAEAIATDADVWNIVMVYVVNVLQ